MTDDGIRMLTPEMVDRLARYQNAEMGRRLAKLKRLNPNAHPATNLMSSTLDYESGDPETIADFLK